MLELVRMEKNSFNSLINSISPGLYGLAGALLPDELQAEQLLSDAVSVFLIREGEALAVRSSMDKKPEARNAPKDRARMKRFVQNHLASDILELGQNRVSQLGSIFKKQIAGEFGPFYTLSLKTRAALYMKERLKLGRQDVEQALSLSRVQLVEALANGRAHLLAAVADDKTEEETTGIKGLNSAQAALINAYLDGNLDPAMTAEAEGLLASNEAAALALKEKVRQRELLLEKIPAWDMERDSWLRVKAELRGIVDELYPKTKKSLAGRLAEVLDTTILEF